MAGAIERAAPSCVAVWVVAGAGHTKGPATAPVEWERTVIDFRDGALVGR